MLLLLLLARIPPLEEQQSSTGLVLYMSVEMITRLTPITNIGDSWTSPKNI